MDLQNKADNLLNRLPNFLTKYKRYYKACLVGLVSLILQLIVFNLLRLHIKATIANTIAVEIAIISNFILNHHFTFKDKKGVIATKAILVRKFLTFNLVSLSSMVIQYICLHLSTKYFGNHPFIDNSAVIIGIILGSMANFLWYRFAIWND